MEKSPYPSARTTGAGVGSTPGIDSSISWSTSFTRFGESSYEKPISIASVRTSVGRERLLNSLL
jgi:hypothetical protein